MSASPVKTTYIGDMATLVFGVPGADRFKDGPSGPAFDRKLAKDAILVLSVVTKEQGYHFLPKNSPKWPTAKGRKAGVGTQQELSGKEEADGWRNVFDPNRDKGTYKYSFLWENADKGKNVKNLATAIAAAVKEKGLSDELEKVVKATMINLDSHKGQLLNGEKLNFKADLDGRIQK